MFQKLIELKESGFLSQMVKSGLMSSKVYVYLEIYMWVDARKTVTKKTLSDVVAEAEAYFGKSSSTIWRAVRVIKNIK